MVRLANLVVDAFWSNKRTGITAGVPSEAELTPQLWGKIRVVKE